MPLIQAGNRTFIRCDRNGAGRNVCEEQHGLTARSWCQKREVNLESGIMTRGTFCVCDSDYGFLHPAIVSSDPQCFENACMKHRDACSVMSGTTIAIAIVASLNVAFSLFVAIVAGRHLRRVLKRLKKDGLNAKTTTSVWAMLFAFFRLAFALVRLAVVVWRDEPVGWRGIAYGTTTCGFASFAMASFLNLGLMWLKVANSMRTMSKSSTNIDRGPILLVLAVCLVFSGGIIWSQVTVNKLVEGALFLMAIIVTALAFDLGAYHLTRLSGKRSERSPAVSHIIQTAKLFTAGAICLTVLNGACK